MVNLQEEITLWIYNNFQPKGWYVKTLEIGERRALEEVVNNPNKDTVKQARLYKSDEDIIPMLKESMVKKIDRYSSIFRACQSKFIKAEVERLNYLLVGLVKDGLNGLLTAQESYPLTEANFLKDQTQANFLKP